MFFLYRFAAGRSASLDHLLHFLTSNLYSQPKKEKLKAQQLLFLIAESNSFDSSASTALLAAKTLADNGVEVFVFKVGGSIEIAKCAIFSTNCAISYDKRAHFFCEDATQKITR